ncbi:leucine-rich repeat-containing protein 59-like [Homarus americanus]|uniref:Leucine-rich repeat-containing protein 59-like n=1 Tax=Homarus americanus TaxID=6706 RepID=A0A8J5MKR7_HOMAM|nr:leucine-rich repeat-containing protein 59-like [Homarus americanus]KAG7155044.1 Leucine-rich repeat-containing protein 59-like [Homarus americanus]
MAKNNLRDKLDGNELDLSMMSLVEVPVKEIAALPRATKIDLSNNQLSSLPSNFAQTLGNITHLELGSNKLKDLPTNFYKLQNLKHLDLYNNQLTDLPLSFCQLRSLKWLDLKGNPLNPSLRKIAGDCLNQKECEAAARNIIAHLKKLQNQMENEKQEKLKKEKEKEDAKARAEEEKQAKKRAEKKAAREKRKAELRAVQESQKTAVNGTAGIEKQYSAVPKPAPPALKHKKSKSGGLSFLAWINILMLVCLLGVTVAGLYVYTDGDLTPNGISAALPRIVENASILISLTTEALHPENLTRTANSVVDSTSAAWTSLQELSGDISIHMTPFVEKVKAGFFELIEFVLCCYDWIVKNVDWDSVYAAFTTTVKFFYEQWLVICEELSKNEALMAVWAPIRTRTAFIVEYFEVVFAIIWGYVSFGIEYIQEEGPGILSVVKEQSAAAFHSAKQSIEGLVN